jgi:hypothetical protein
LDEQTADTEDAGNDGDAEHDGGKPIARNRFTDQQSEQHQQNYEHHAQANRIRPTRTSRHGSLLPARSKARVRGFMFSLGSTAKHARLRVGFQIRVGVLAETRLWVELEPLRPGSASAASRVGGGPELLMLEGSAGPIARKAIAPAVRLLT